MLIVGEAILKQELLKDADKSHIKNSSHCPGSATAV